MKYIFSFFVLLLCTKFIFAQDSIYNNFFGEIFKSNSRNIVIDAGSGLPYFKSENISTTENETFIYTLYNVTTEIINKNIIPESLYKKIPNEFDILPQISIIKKNKKSYALIGTLRIDSTSGNIEVLKDFELKHSTLKNGKLENDVKALKTQSVLASGKWIKISTTQNGIHKISYSDLKKWNINPDEIDPRKIKIFGNGSKMLPENNSDFRHDDIVENSIFVNGEADGIFNENDYILFYAEGIQYWNFDSNKNDFSHAINLYSDNSYYFINFDGANGKRITELATIEADVTKHVNNFLDFAMHEIDLRNNVKSGKMWLGEQFETYNSTMSIPFSFPNIESDSIALLKIGVAGKAPTPTSFNISVGNTQNYATINGTNGYTNDYAKYTISTTNIANPTSSINVNLKFNSNGQSTALGWLDYIEVKAWRKLIFSGSQMPFRNPNIIEQNSVSMFTISNASGVNIWDISEQTNPQLVKGSFSGNSFSFKVKTDSLKEFIAFNGSSYFTPTYVGEQANQNLHSLPQTDYIIVSNSKFVPQAKELGQIHYELEGYSYVVVTPELIYNEFSSGKQDPTAIRDFVKMFYDRANNNEELPKFLLLFGDASYDYKNRISNNNNLVPIFESANSLSPTSSYCSDDFYGLLDSGEGEDCSGNLDIAIGRFPVNTIEQAEATVKKVRIYISATKLSAESTNCSYGSCKISNMANWRNNICFICDDGDGNLHLNQTERLAKNIDTTVNFLNIDKIYLDAFNQISSTGGERAPEVNEAIDRAMAKGALIINYIGHGGEDGWTNERILNLSSIQSWSNSCNMPVMITATCEFSRVDDPGRVAAGEQAFLNANGGPIALLTTNRIAFSTYNEALNKSFFKKAFNKENERYLTLGELTAFSKTDNSSVQYLRNFSLFGDPALTMAIPKNKIITTKINDKDILAFNDSIGALSKITVDGYIADENGNKIDTFNGIVYPTIFDKATPYTTLGTGEGSYPTQFMLQKNIIFKGKAEVKNGDFTFTFIVPKDIKYNYGNGRISYYAENGSTDACGWYDNITIGGSDSTIEDYEGPVISLFMNDIHFKDGNITDENPTLLAYLSDENGINTTGGIGHDIQLTIDGNISKSTILNDYFENDLNNYQSGSLYFQLKNLSEGEHTLTLKAWDILNNSSENNINFIVSSSAELALTHVLNYPNPFSDYTYFRFDHNHPCCMLEMKISIFSINGQKVKTIEKEINVSGYGIEPIKWDGTDDYGNPLGGGIYIYKIALTSDDGKFTEKSEKLVILK